MGVICHTRELAYQIKHEFDRFAKYFQDVKTGVVYGGMPIAKDKEMLKDSCPHILIGTPGRVLGLTREKDLKLEKLSQFVLDECDKCLDKLDMRKDIQQIFIETPKKKQVMMFSATMTADTRALCKKFMQDPHAAWALAVLQEAHGEGEEPYAERPPRCLGVQPGGYLREVRAEGRRAGQALGGVQLPLHRHPLWPESGGPHCEVQAVQGVPEAHHGVHGPLRPRH